MGGKDPVGRGGSGKAPPPLAGGPNVDDMPSGCWGMAKLGGGSADGGREYNGTGLARDAVAALVLLGDTWYAEALVW